MPRSNNSEESDSQTLLSQDSIELGFDEKASQYAAPPSRFRRFMSSNNAKRLVVSLVIVITVGVLTFIALTPRSGYSPDVLSNHCGSTSEEAIALGCKFDVLNYAWQPPECFDEDVFNRYWEKSQEHGPLKWYADSTFTTELPQDIELLMHTPRVWSEHRFHILHCMYAWELIHHAVTLKKPVVEFISHYNHTMHCADTAMTENWTENDTSIKASHNRCVMMT
jgi:hypothetical protein